MKTHVKMPRIERAKLWIPHQDREIAFEYPPTGPNTYTNTGKAILDRNQRLPKGDELASLIYAAYCIPEVHDEPEFAGLRKIRGDSCTWVFNRNLWTLEGVYVVQDPKAIGNAQSLNQSNLERRLRNSSEVNGVRFSKNGAVRFAPKESYQLEEQTPEKLAENGFIIASFGKEGAEKIAEVSTKYRSKPYVSGLDVNEPKQRVSAVGEYNHRFWFVGDFWSCDYYSHAFGVLK